MANVTIATNGLSSAVSTPTLHIIRVASLSVVAAQRQGNNWEPVAGIRPYASLGNADTKTARQHQVVVDLERKLAGDGDIYIFQWSVSVIKSNGEQPTAYSRPLIVAKQQIDDLLKGKPEANPGLVTQLDVGSTITRVVPAGDNRYLIARTVRDDVVVVDLEIQSEVARTTMKDSAMLVAGKSMVITFDRRNRTFTQYPLPTLEPAVTRPMHDNAVINQAAWGAANNGRIAVLAQISGEKSQTCMLLDPNTGRLVRLLLDNESPSRRRTPSLLDAIPLDAKFDLRMSQDGEVISLWAVDNAPMAIHVMRQDRRRWKYQRHDKDAAYGFLSPGGNLVFTAGSVLAGDLVTLHDIPLPLPTLHDDYFLVLGDIGSSANGDSIVRSNRQTYTWNIASAVDNQIHKVIELPGPLTLSMFEARPGHGLPPDERFCCIPQRSLLSVVLPDQPQQLRLIRWTDALPSADKPPQAGLPVETAASTPNKPASRTWTDATGKHSTQAKFIAAKEGYVKLEKEDGSSVVLKLSALSQADQDYVAKQEQ
jgi:hypothetical protein